MARTVTCFILDVSPGMSEEVYDEETGRTASKLDLCKEYVSRKIAPMIQSGRKTEHAGVLTFGGATDNPFFAKSENEGPEASAHDPQDYVGVASIFPPQQARPQMLGVINSIQVGQFNGNPQAKVKQVGWEIVLAGAKAREILLNIIGADFDARATQDVPDEEFAKLPKIERFWRKFCDAIAVDLTEEDRHLMPRLGNLQDALSAVRGPQVDPVNSTANKSVFRIGSAENDSKEAIEINIRISKATALARPQSLKKVIASKVTRPKVLPESVIASQGQSSRAAQSQTQLDTVGRPSASMAAGIAGIEADVSRFTKYYVLKKNRHDGEDVDMDANGDARRIDDEDDENDSEPEYEEIEVDKENCTKAYRFGSTWVPMNDEDFETMETTAGFDVLGFLKAGELRRQQEMGEVTYIWPDPEDTKSQVQVSAIVQAMQAKNAMAVVRYVYRNGAEPKLGLAKPMTLEDDKGCFEGLHWVQMPFAEDEKAFFFPSLTELKSKSGKPIIEHRLLPTEEQDSLMHDLVDEMDLDDFADPETAKPWYDCSESFNPAIHRMREAIYHLAVTSDLNSNPMPPPHPTLVKYVNPPAQNIETSSETVQQLIKALDIKAAPPPKKKFERKVGGTDAREDLDIDALFANDNDDSAQVKEEQTSPTVNGKGKGAAVGKGLGSPTVKRSQMEGPSTRVIGRQDPVHDFIRIVSESSGNEIMEKAVYIRGFERFCKNPDFKHRDFWNEFDNAKPPLGSISDAEAEAALTLEQNDA
ncbi:hypothetical protein QFC22_003011 [Naganishia vaughanmartiniae]|uniref:Uncharacterized protein n=1 Tax=Naganishia vaughanmartiniae TaxID=1424756 RepID=A0ACC2X7W4_9TREE|nr:hypothetical protein QFC22_003011 [Naganishia vaughanmartiniae]